MKLSATRDVLLKPLQAVIGVVERRQTMPILSNVLLVARNGELSVTATDLEVELVATTAVDVESGGEITVSGRKLLDICKALPDGAKVSIQVSGEKLGVRSGRSRFSLTTLPAAEFPTVEDIQAGQTITVSQEVLGRLIEKTHFSIAGTTISSNSGISNGSSVASISSTSATGKGVNGVGVANSMLSFAALSLTSLCSNNPLTDSRALSNSLGSSVLAMGISLAV